MGIRPTLYTAGMMKPRTPNRHGGGGPRNNAPADRPKAAYTAPSAEKGRDRPVLSIAPRPQSQPPAQKSDAPQRHRGGPPRHAPAREPEAPRGGVWLYGLHVVAAALANPQRRLRRLLLSGDAEAALAARLPPPWPLQPERVEPGKIEHAIGRDAVHQGVALLADPLAPPMLAQVLERSGPLLVLDQVTDPRNIGAILRSAAAFGAAAVVLQERFAPMETGALAKAASGALETVPVLRAVNLARTLVALKAAGLWVVGLDAGGKNLVGTALAERRVVLVLGGEGAGLRRLTRDSCDEIAGLAMVGPMESLNVSAAAAVALYELGRRPG